MRADSLHRLMKVLVDGGEAESVEAAAAMFSKYGIRLTLGKDVATSVALQVIALTVINTAARSFQGNVHVEGYRDVILLAPGFEGMRLADFCAWAGVKAACTTAPSWPEVLVGEIDRSSRDTVLVPWADGWTIGVGPPPRAAAKVFAPACVAAGALAVSEAFSLLRRDNPCAGRRAVTFSLWSMKPDLAQPPEGTSAALNDDLWLVGLGHLGQAYCWTLGLMQHRAGTRLLMQDVDAVTESTLSTSVLSAPVDIGREKTRVVADWMEHRGFKTRIVERRFDAATRVAPGEPATALFGVDNAAARRACEAAGFSRVLDAGLGAGYRDFRAMRVRGFPGASSADKIWAHDPASSAAPVVARAYEALLAAGTDPCGVTTLATRAVGAPFVGCYASAVLIAELLRRQSGMAGRDVIDINLRSPESAEVA